MSETDGKVTWFEVPAGDSARARGFYSLLFGWTFTPFEGAGDYYTTAEGGGAVYENTEGKGIVVYFGTSDLDSAVAKVRELGGESGDPMEIPGGGRYATCSDTEGNAFGLFQAG